MSSTPTRSLKYLAGWLWIPLAVGALAFLLLRVRGECAGQGYPFLPVTPNALATWRDAAALATVVVLAAVAFVLLPIQIYGARPMGPMWLGRAWGVLIAVAIWAAWGFHMNRYVFASLWRTPEKIGSLTLPSALLDPRVWWVNVGLTLAAAIAGMGLALLLQRWVPRCEVRRAPRLVTGLSGLVLLLFAPLSVLPATLGVPDPAYGDIILISLDATRADRLGCYGNPDGLTPHLDALAADAVRFERAYCQEPWTLTSHMSMLTGLYPDVHGLDFGRALPPSLWTVPERLRDAGWRTAASVYDCFLLSPRFGYAAGFDLYREDQHRARSRADAAARWLSESDRPGFLFLHFYDPHSDTGVLPYEASEEFLARFAPGAEKGWSNWTGPAGASEALRRVNEEGLPLPEELRMRLRRLYDAGVAETDAAVGHFLDRLREEGRYDDALILVVADHGESLGEAGHFMHERLQEETLRVPLLVKWPRGKAGVRRDLAETVDLAPTILAAAGLPGESVSQGVDLADAAGTGRSQVFHRSGPDYALTTADGWRLVYRWDASSGVTLNALRRAGEEPGDGSDLSKENPEVVDRWVATIDALHRANATLGARFAGGQVEMNDADEDLLRSLGYIE